MPWRCPSRQRHSGFIDSSTDGLYCLYHWYGASERGKDGSYVVTEWIARLKTRMADAERAEALVESQLGKTIQGDPRTVELVSGTQGVWRDIGVVESPLTDPKLAPRQADEGAPAACLVFDPQRRRR